MLKTLYQSVMATLVLAVLACGAYPALVTAIGQLVFPRQAAGSLLVSRDGKTLGSYLIGQGFSRPSYFHGRPSAAGANGYDAASSSGSNLGPTNPKFIEGLKTNIDVLLKENPGVKRGEIPGDLVTASASGLDPHVTPEGALVQVSRVAQARGADRDQVRALVLKHVEGPQWGLFGEPVVNVLALNLDLDQLFPIRP
jgi:K+-transporting ATPase ATPase C chain